MGSGFTTLFAHFLLFSFSRGRGPRLLGFWFLMLLAFLAAPSLSFCADSQPVRTNFEGDRAAAGFLQGNNAAPRALAAADLNRDGAPDLVAGYAVGSQGIVTVQLGNPDAYAPTDQSLYGRIQAGYNPASLQPTTTAFEVPQAADFVQTGYFNPDNNIDVLVGALGGDLYLLKGDGTGALGEPKAIDLPGKVTALKAGEFRTMNGRTDIAVAVSGSGGPKLLIFEGTAEGLAAPMEHSLAAPATAMQFGMLDDDSYMDLAVATGARIEVLHGWGRKQDLSLESRIESIDVGDQVRGLDIGFFAWNREGSNQLVTLTESGSIRVLQRGALNDTPFSEEEKLTRSRGYISIEGTVVTDIENLPNWKRTDAAGWTTAREIAAPALPRADGRHLFLRTHISYRETDDVLIAGGDSRLHVVRQADTEAQTIKTERSSFEIAPSPVRDLATMAMQTDDSPVAVVQLPPKLNGRRDIVLLQSGSSEPAVIPLAPTATITVDRTDDPSVTAPTTVDDCTEALNDCSLRGAVQFANANPGTVISLPANTYTLSIHGTNVTGCDGNAQGDLDINASTTITGAGSLTTIIRQHGDGPAGLGDRIMCLNVPLALNINYAFTGITITGGRNGQTGMGTGYGGGGIIGGEKGNTHVFTDVRLSNNKVTQPNIGGGGMQITGGDLTITNCLVGGTSNPTTYADRDNVNAANSTSTSGGGVYFTPSAPGHTASTGILTVTNTTFQRNTQAGIGGGGLNIETIAFALPGGFGSGSANIGGNTQFLNNSGTGSGGGMISQSLDFTISSSNFQNNFVSNRGAAIYVGGSTIHILDGTNLPGITMSGNTVTPPPAGEYKGSSVSTAVPLNVEGTHVQLDGSIEASTGGTWTNNTGSVLSPTDVIVVGGTYVLNNSTMNISGDLVHGAGSIVGGTWNANSSTVNILGNMSVNLANGGVFNGGTSTFNFNSTTANQSINGPSTIPFANLNINKTGRTLTLGTTVTFSGNLSLNAGTFDLSTFTANRTAAGGTLTVGPNTTMRMGGGVSLPANFSTHSIGAGSTIEYYGTAQNVAALNSSQTYKNLLLAGSGAKTMQGAITVDTQLTINGGSLDTNNGQNYALNIGGGWSNNVASGFTARNGTVTFNGAGTQTIGGSQTTTFNNLTINKPGTTALLGINQLMAGNLTLTAGTLDLNGFSADHTGPGGTLTVTNGTLLQIRGTNTLPASYATHSIGATSTIEYAGSNQSVAALNSAQLYGNLLTSGSGTKTLAGAIGVATSLTIGTGTTLDASVTNFGINIAGNWTNGGTFNPRSGTVTFNGTTGTQTVSGNTSFFDLTLNNSGATTDFGGNSISVARNFTTTAGTMNGSTSTFTFTGATGAISGAAAKNFNNLVINAGAGITNSTGGNTTIKNNYTNNGTFTQAAALSTTFDASNATHSLAGGGTTTFGGVTISGGTTVNAGSHSFNVVGGSLTIDGTFNGNTGTVTLNGATAQTITGTGTKSFNGLTANNGNGITLNNSAAAVDASVGGALTLTSNLNIAAGAVLQQSGTSAGTGDAIGTVRRTDLDNTSKAFGSPYVNIAINTGAAPTTMDVTLVKSAPVDFPAAVLRNYTLAPTGGGPFSSTVSLHYLPAELNGNTETLLALWKKTATWVPQGRTGLVDTVNKAVTLTGITSFSEWTLAKVDPPTISKAFGAATIPLNGTTSLTFTITNPNTNAALNGIGFTDNLPSGLVVATPNNLNNTCGGTPTATAGSGTISLTGVTLAASGSCTLSVNVTGTTAGAKDNTSDAISSNESGAGSTSNTATVTVLSPPTISKAFGAASIPLNGSTSLTITISNSNASALNGIAFTDSLPSGLVVATPNNLNNTCGGTPTAVAASGSISLTGGTVAASGSCTLSVNVTGTSAGDKNNTTGAVSSTNGGTGAASNTATLAVVAPLSITKAFGASNIGLNASTSLTFTITNPAANTVAQSGVAFTDSLPAGLVVSTPNGLVNNCSGTATAVAASGSITLTGGSVALNSSCTVVVNVTGTTAGQKDNVSGNVSSTTGGTGNTASASVVVATPPTISKAFGAAAIPLNGTTSLTFTINNTNTGFALTGVAFNDSLPSGLVVATPNNLNNTCAGTPTAVAGSGSITLSGATVAASSSCTLSLNVTGTTAGVKDNTTDAVTSTETGPGATSNTATITVVGPPAISKAFGVASIPLNGVTSLTFTISNANTTAGLSGVAFTDSLPTGLLVATPNNISNTCNGTPTAVAASGSISLTGGTVAASGSCTLSVDVTGTTAGDKNNTTGTISSTEGGTGATSNTATLAVVAPLSISKAFGASGIPLNGTTSLTFTITNPAVNTVAHSGVAFTDSLPAGLVVSTPNGLVNNCSGTATAVAGSGSITLTGGSVGINTSCTVIVNVTGTTEGVKNNLSDNVTSTTGGTGNTASASLSVSAPPTISKAFGATTIPLNGTTSLTFTITNSSAAITLTGIAFNDTLPAGMVVATPNGLNNTCGGTPSATAGGSTISLSGTTLAPTASCTLTVNVTGTTGGEKDNTTDAITSIESGAGATSNTATITVVGPPAISKAFGAASIPLNGVTSLTFSITNANATAGLSSVAFTDSLPAGLLVATPNNISNTCGGTPTATAGSGSISLTDGTVAASGSCTLSVDVTGISAGDQNNTTGAISSTEGGTGATSNTATLAVVAPLSISKAFGASGIPLNGTTSLTFTITNPAVNTVAQSGVAFSDSLPTGLVVSTPNGLVNNCSGAATAVAASGSITLTGGTVGINTSCTVIVDVTGTTEGVKNNLSGNVTSTTGGTGNTASASLSVAAPPTISKLFGAATIPLNANTSLTFTITNSSTAITLNGITFNDNLPAGLVVATPNNINNTCGGTPTATAGSGTISLSGVTLAPNTSCTLTVDVTGTTAGVKNNTTDAISSTESGAGDPSNTATITVVAPPDISKQFGATSILVGASTTLSFTINNANTTVALADVAMSDTLPAGLVVSTPNGLTGSCGAGTIAATAGTNSVTLTAGDISASGSCTFSVDVTGIATGTQVNTTGAVTSSNGGTGNTATDSIDVGCSTITVSPATIPPGIGGAAYSATFGQTGGFGAIGFSVTGTLPNGISFVNGVLSGTPVQTGSFPITVTATDSAGCTGSQAYTLVIDCPVISVDPLTLPAGTKGTTYPSVAFGQTGGVGSVTFSENGILPQGMNFNNGVLSGKPKQTGSFPLTVTVTDSMACTGSQDYILAIGCSDSDINIAPDTLPAGAANVAYPDTTFTASGGLDPYAFQQSGALPAGMSFVGDTLTGTPTESGTFPFTISVTDSAGCAQSKGYVLTISCAGVPITISPASLPAASLNTPYPSTTFTPSGGTGPYSFLVFGALPAGMSVDQGTGILSGTPTEPGAFPFLVQATDANGCSGTQQYTLTTCIFCDDFENDPLLAPPPGWSKVKGFQVVQTGATQSLEGTATGKATILSPTFPGVPERTVELNGFTLLSAGTRYFLYGWFEDKLHCVKLILKQDVNAIVLMQKNGFTSKKAKFIPPSPLTTNSPYDLRVTYEGGVFQVFLNGQLLGTMKSIATPSGDNAFIVFRSTTGAQVQSTLDSIRIY